MWKLSAKWIFLITVSIFGSAFLGIFLSTIIFEGPSLDSEKSFENEPLEKSAIPKAIIESPVEEEPKAQEPTPIESPVEEEPKAQEPTPIESPVEEEPKAQEPTPTELEGTVTTSSSTGTE